MSAGSRVEVVQSAEELQREDHVSTDPPIATEEWQGEAEDEEKGHLPAFLGKTVTQEPVGKDKQHKRTEMEKSLGRRRDAQGTNREQVIQADGAAADSDCLVEHSRSRRVSRRAQVKHQRQAVQVHKLQRRNKSPEESKRPGPFFYFGGGNGESIVVPYCESNGWQRIYDKSRLDYGMKWCEVKSTLTYYHFRAGEQLVYQIPNNRILTTKIGLLNSLREYDRVISKINHGKGQRRLEMGEFIPDTFRMDVKVEREAFFSQQDGFCDDKSNIWICKPTGLNQGRGIFLLHTSEDIAAFRARMQMLAESKTNKEIALSMSQAMIAQRYIQNPLLLKGKKFDVRSYLLIACTSPYMVFFRHGYVRLTCDLYDPKSNNLTAHLTNQYMQKRNPLYSILKEETVWSMERFNSYINDKFTVPKSLQRDWVLNVFTKRMQQIMTHCFLAVKSKLECKLGYFDLIGCDFLIDEDFKVWLLEMNCNPALHTNCEVLKDVVPKTVTETLDLTLEIFNKCCSGLKLLPLSSQKDFVLLHCGDTEAVLVTRQRSRRALRTTCSKQRS
ncbi:protein polyglycylase TTLL10 isoform X1 [Tachysurus ichikawai]